VSFVIPEFYKSLSTTIPALFQCTRLPEIYLVGLNGWKVFIPIIIRYSDPEFHHIIQILKSQIVISRYIAPLWGAVVICLFICYQYFTPPTCLYLWRFLFIPQLDVPNWNFKLGNSSFVGIEICSFRGMRRLLTLIRLDYDWYLLLQLFSRFFDYLCPLQLTRGNLNGVIAPPCRLFNIWKYSKYFVICKNKLDFSFFKTAFCRVPGLWPQWKQVNYLWHH